MIVGLTGGIGSGKTTVLQMFEALGALSYVADLAAKELMCTDKTLRSQVLNLFGENSYVGDRLHREYISSIVFKEPAKLKQLNALVHPVVHAHFEQFKLDHPGRIILYESAILFEVGAENTFDYLILVTAPKQERIARILARDALSKEQIQQRMDNQSGDDAKIIRSHFVIQNHDLSTTRQQVQTVYEMLLQTQDTTEKPTNIVKSS